MNFLSVFDILPSLPCFIGCEVLNMLFEVSGRQFSGAFLKAILLWMLLLHYVIVMNVFDLFLICLWCL